jgi:hypothetical protein
LNKLDENGTRNSTVDNYHYRRCYCDNISVEVSISTVLCKPVGTDHYADILYARDSIINELRYALDHVGRTIFVLLLLLIIDLNCCPQLAQEKDASTSVLGSSFLSPRSNL